MAAPFSCITSLHNVNGQGIVYSQCLVQRNANQVYILGGIFINNNSDNML